ncbi:unnamed protein product [Phytophthora fragariaefolia]|uniref:Unnamed protein product n=1 Tax=Phytophthora fragariaefolia TaxID=1490495 RepID=A0A9W6XTA7_9STRA|nr:unnamed protein product [Phytophthora fragariaefolia]
MSRRGTKPLGPAVASPVTRTTSGTWSAERRLQQRAVLEAAAARLPRLGGDHVDDHNDGDERSQHHGVHALRKILDSGVGGEDCVGEGHLDTTVTAF